MPIHRVISEEFIAWAMEQPKGRQERDDRFVVAMAMKRVAHARRKGAVQRALDDLVARASQPFEAFPVLPRQGRGLLRLAGAD